ncbi:MAG: sigma-70 family RNA polymerase sigma factor [Sedimentisphaerales bacterium]|nr:sigma-70 family RNA polymerase sigma factor [Sedimentisphaerales bacterium]
MTEEFKSGEGISNQRVQEFVELLTAHQVRIRGYILSLVRNYNDAEDIMQETSRMMWTRFSDFEPGTDFLAWGRTIAFYRILEYRHSREQKGKSQIFHDELFHILESEAKARKKDRSQDYLHYLRDCLKKLVTHDRLLLRMRYEQNLKVREIARRVGVTIQSVYRNMARIQSQLQLCVQRSAAQEERT